MQHLRLMEQNTLFSGIKAFVFDVDGVMTDGGIFADNDGNLFRTFDAKDAFAMRMASMNGYALGVITGGRSRSIVKRMSVCGVPTEDVYLGSRDKMDDFRDFCTRHHLEPDEIMYFGDDLPDVPVIRACGCGVCPSDAVTEAREAADFVSPFPGGRGCVRDTLERVMRSQGRWKFDVECYKNNF